MGLDVIGWGCKHTYHHGYSGIHQIRTVGMKCLGLDKKLTEHQKEEILNDSRGLYTQEPTERQLSYILDIALYGNIAFRENFNSLPLIKPLFTDEDLQPLWQLFHFSDCEGILIRKGFLKNVDYSQSYYLGCLDDLLENLVMIREWILHNLSRVHEQEVALINKLYDVVNEATNDAEGVIKFC